MIYYGYTLKKKAIEKVGYIHIYLHTYVHMI